MANTEKRLGRPKLPQRRQYGFIQMERESYEYIRDYCNENALKIGWFVAKASKKYIESLKKR